MVNTHECHLDMFTWLFLRFVFASPFQTCLLKWSESTNQLAPLPAPKTYSYTKHHSKNLHVSLDKHYCWTQSPTPSLVKSTDFSFILIHTVELVHDIFWVLGFTFRKMALWDFFVYVQHKVLSWCYTRNRWRPNKDPLKMFSLSWFHFS